MVDSPSGYFDMPRRLPASPSANNKFASPSLSYRHHGHALAAAISPVVCAASSPRTSKRRRNPTASCLVEETRAWIQELDRLDDEKEEGMETEDRPLLMCNLPPLKPLEQPLSNSALLDSVWLDLLQEAQEIDSTLGSLPDAKGLHPPTPSGHVKTSARLSSLPFGVIFHSSSSCDDIASMTFPEPPKTVQPLRLRVLNRLDSTSGPPSAPLPERPNWMEQEQQKFLTHKRRSTDDDGKTCLQWSESSRSASRSRSSSNATSSQSRHSALFSPRTSNMSAFSAFTDVSDAETCSSGSHSLMAGDGTASDDWEAEEPTLLYGEQACTTFALDRETDHQRIDTSKSASARDERAGIVDGQEQCPQYQKCTPSPFDWLQVGD